MGCDGILDKPIIIAEGFDAGNNISIDNLVAYYRNDLAVFTRNGYDLVFVNYNDGRDFIENNAEVLKRVIQDINNKKVGHAEINKLSIIGVSMSGLVARWALRQMENAGQNHEVARLICLDTPHKGANSSPGVSYVAADFANRGIASGFLEAFLYNIVPELSAIDSPAAKEQLLFQNTSMTPNVFFSLFQNALVNLGNGGYPSQCKNISFVNGSLNGANFNRKFENNDVIVPGDKIWDSDFILGVCFNFIDCWSNVPNQNTEVYNEDKYPNPLVPFSFLICGIQFSRRSINLPYNLDRLAGGFNYVPGDYFFQFTSTAPRFSFVPTYSAVDYKGALNTDADYSIIVFCKNNYPSLIFS
jgi:pimeloyl-ACP methyl ester carboxylesterase